MSQRTRRFSRLLAVAILFIWASSAVAQVPASGIDKINHVIWIIQENRSYDNYFRTYPGGDGIPKGTCLPLLPGSKQCVQPFHMPEGQPAYDLNHDWDTIHAAYNHGTMDGFVWAEGSRFTMGYYDERDIPNYWRECFDFNQSPNAALVTRIPPDLKPSQPILKYISYPPSVSIPKFAPPRMLHLRPPPASDKK